MITTVRLRRRRVTIWPGKVSIKTCTPPGKLARRRHENEKEDAPVRTNGGHRPLFIQIKMATLRIFARSVLTAIRAPPVTGYSKKNAFPLVDQIQKRCVVTVEVHGPKNTKKLVELPEYEVTTDPKEWAYVEMSLRNKLIPEPPKDAEDLPSGWKPQKASALSEPYFVERTKSHMIPVYLLRTQRGIRRVTRIRRIQGDIMKLEAELKAYVEQKVGKQIGSQINEPAGLIKFRGDYVSHCKNFLESKGF